MRCVHAWSQQSSWFLQLALWTSRTLGTVRQTCKPSARAHAPHHAELVPRGLEPRTLRLLAVRSDQLSYETSCTFAYVLMCMPKLLAGQLYLRTKRWQWIWNELPLLHPSLEALLSPHPPRLPSLPASRTPVPPGLTFLCFTGRSISLWSHAGLNRGPYGY